MRAGTFRQRQDHFITRSFKFASPIHWNGALWECKNKSRDRVCFPTGKFDALELRGMNAQEITEKAHVMIKLVGLQDFAQAWPASLSGGMAQRVAIARALIQDPDLLLLDEPFGSLDALTRERMGVELLRIWQSERKTVVMVTHSISEALLLADRVIMLTPRPGRILLDVMVDLPRPRQENVRYSPKFIELSKALRSAIG
jgi:NitT/TauT family transport system ATP-binding protein